MTIFEPNPVVRPTGAEAGEFLDEAPLSEEHPAGEDPTRRPTGSLPLESTPERGDDEELPADGFAMLEHDHREIERLFQEFQREGGDGVLRELCEHLTHNSQREEAALIPVLRRDVDGGPQLAERMETENSTLATMIAELYDSATPERIPELVEALHGAMVAYTEALTSEILPSMRASGVEPQRLATSLQAVERP